MDATRFRHYLFVVAIVPIAMTGEYGTCDEVEKKQMRTVRVQDIPGTVKIVGRLGHPLGSLLRVRGEWIKPDIRAKERSLFFRVTQVNGKELEEHIDLHGLQVEAIFGNHDGRKLKAGELWEWRFGWDGTEPPPKRLEGEVWELIGVETGAFDAYSDEAWEEIGEPAEQTPPFATGFHTKLEYIAMKKRK